MEKYCESGHQIVECLHYNQPEVIGGIIRNTSLVTDNNFIIFPFYRLHPRNPLKANLWCWFWRSFAPATATDVVRLKGLTDGELLPSGVWTASLVSENVRRAVRTMISRPFRSSMSNLMNRRVSARK